MARSLIWTHLERATSFLEHAPCRFSEDALLRRFFPIAGATFSRSLSLSLLRFLCLLACGAPKRQLEERKSALFSAADEKAHQYWQLHDFSHCNAFVRTVSFTRRASKPRAYTIFASSSPISLLNVYLCRSVHSPSNAYLNLNPPFMLSSTKSSYFLLNLLSATLK